MIALIIVVFPDPTGPVTTFNVPKLKSMLMSWIAMSAFGAGRTLNCLIDTAAEGLVTEGIPVLFEISGSAIPSLEIELRLEQSVLSDESNIFL